MACYFRRRLQLSPGIFYGFFVLFVFWIDEVNSSQSSSVNRASVSHSPIFSFLFSGRISQIGSILLATRDLGWQSPVFLSVSLWTTYILREAFLAIE